MTAASDAKPTALWPDHLPVPAHRLIGRESELSQLGEQLKLSNVRLLTLTGMGGIGKTRLALELAAQAGADYRNGVRFLDLTQCRDPNGVLSALCSAVDLRHLGRRSPLDALVRTLRRRHLLLVLDNVEHVLTAAPLVGELLAACPELCVVTTSRAPLRLSWEYAFAVQPLGVPNADSASSPETLLACPSVALLIERMGATGTGALREPLELHALAEVCRRLAGIPLAIELAAARARLLPPRALLARLGQPLELLTQGRRDGPDRHQTLRRTFDWSFDLLEAGDQELFQRLGVFVGGCRIDAVQHIAAADSASEYDVIAALGRLLDSSFLHRGDNEGDGEPRLLMLEPAREYALDRLVASGAAPEVRAQHAAFFLQLAEQAEPELSGPRQKYWLARLYRDHGNLQAALRWLVDTNQTELALRLSGALAWFWWVCGYAREGLARLTEVLGQPASAAPSNARARVLAGAGLLAYHHGDFASSKTLLRDALDLFRALDNAPAIGNALNWLGNCALSQGDLTGAQSLYEQSLSAQGANPDERGVALTTLNLGLVAFERGDLALAHSLLTRSVAAERVIGDARGTALALGALGLVQAYRSEIDLASASLRESLILWRDAGERTYLPLILEAYAVLTIAAGDARRGLHIAAGAVALRDELDAPRPPVWSPQLEHWLDAARERVGPDATVVWSAGLKLTADECVTEALELDLARLRGPSALSATHERTTRPHGLTAREAEVLELLANGYANKEIARELVISVPTVERHLVTIYGKIQARNRAEATAYAIHHHLVRPRPSADS